MFEVKEKDGKTFLVVHGLEMEVKSDEECAKADVMLCMPCSRGEPAVDSDVETCTECGCKVWVDKRTNFKGPKKLCIQCALSDAKGEQHLSA